MFRLSRNYDQANTHLNIQLRTVLYTVVLDFSTIYINIKHKITIKGKRVKMKKLRN
jgi:hypothetical protein